MRSGEPTAARQCSARSQGAGRGAAARSLRHGNGDRPAGLGRSATGCSAGAQRRRCSKPDVRSDRLATRLSARERAKVLSRWGFSVILAKHVKAAAKVQESLASKRVTPHTLRHSCAMNTLQANNGDVRKVSLMLGHASITSTEVYLHAGPDREAGNARCRSSTSPPAGTLPGTGQASRNAHADKQAT